MIEPLAAPLSVFPDDPGRPPAPVARPSWAFMARHPAHWFALGFGTGLSRIAPGTAGTLWAWAEFVALAPLLGEVQWAWVVAVSLPLGWLVCTITARNMDVQDPGSVVWDEVAAFWLVLWLVAPASLAAQAVAFGLFRFFDAVKPGPVGWADRVFHVADTRADPWAWHKAGLGIMFDDLVAAFCTLLVIALWRFVLPG